MREVPEWKGRTDDAKVPDRVRLRVDHKAKGKCCVCTLVTLNTEIDHIVPLILGGEHRETNLQLICRPCHKEKTKLDVKLKAKVSRVRKRHIGIKKPRTMTRWRRFDGSIREAGRER